LGWAISLALALAGAAFGAGPDKTKGFFPMSVWYAGGTARAPMLETVTPESAAAWRKDVAQIKRLGFNTVRCWVEWTACEREEGRYDFSALRLVCDLAAEAGLKVICQVYIDSAPDWVGHSHPASKFVASNGLAVESQSAPGFCFDHPGVQEKILRFFTETARAVKDKPAFYGWDLWSEPHIINWAEIYYLGDTRYIQFCYCPSSQARFRAWIKAKYGTLEALNRSWYRTFRSWEEVEPPRFGTILTYTDYVDWKEYISDKLAEDLKLKAQAVKSVLPESVATSHSAIPGLFSRPDWSGTPDDGKMNDSVDFYGVSIYPKHAWTVRPWSPFFRSSGLDFARSMAIRNGGFYVGELQAGYGVFGMKVSVPVVGADMRDWMWSMLAYGARAVNVYAYYPMSSGYEAGGYGLVELDGKVTERAEAAGAVARTVTENMGLFLGARPPRATIAVLYNPLAHNVGGQQSFTSEGQSVGVNTLSESLQGVHRAFFERGVAVDFLHVRDLGRGRAKEYRLLIAPYPVMISQDSLRHLTEYVRAGGTLVAEARPGWIDERGYSSPVIPGGGLHEVFGCREATLRPVAKTGTITMTAESELLPLLKPGDKLDSLFFAESFELLGPQARVLAAFEDGRPAIVASRYGQGRAVIVGSFVGSAYHHFQNPANGRFFAGLADWLAVERPVVVVSSDPTVLVEGRLLEGPDYKLLFGFNRGEKAAAAKFSVFAGGGRVEAVEMETKRKLAPASSGGRVEMEKTLAPGEVWVVHLKSGK
jgi:beta-galactosidase